MIAALVGFTAAAWFAPPPPLLWLIVRCTALPLILGYWGAAAVIWLAR